MLRELFGAGATVVPSARSAADAMSAVTPLPVAAATPITINATINNQADAEHLFRRLQRLQERRGRGGDLRV